MANRETQRQLAAWIDLDAMNKLREMRASTGRTIGDLVTAAVMAYEPTGVAPQPDALASLEQRLSALESVVLAKTSKPLDDQLDRNPDNELVDTSQRLDSPLDTKLVDTSQRLDEPDLICLREPAPATAEPATPAPAIPPAAPIRRAGLGRPGKPAGTKIERNNEIRRLRDAGHSTVELMEKFQLSRRSIQKITNS